MWRFAFTKAVSARSFAKLFDIIKIENSKVRMRYRGVHASMKSARLFLIMLLSSCVSRPQPPFDLSKAPVNRLVDIASWLGGIPDWRNTATILGGLNIHQTSEEKISPQKDYILFFHRLFLDQNVTIDYKIIPNTHVNSSMNDEHAFMFIRINSADVCLTYNLLFQKFGRPYSRITATDAGGISYTWDIGKSSKFYSYIKASSINSQDQCMYYLMLYQSTEPTTKNTM